MVLAAGFQNLPADFEFDKLFWDEKYKLVRLIHSMRSLDCFLSLFCKSSSIDRSLNIDNSKDSVIAFGS